MHTPVDIKHLLGILWILTLLLLPGCASMMSSATGQLAEDLAVTMMDSDDPETVRAAIPAYLLLTDSMLRSDPANVPMLLSAATLNGAFAGAFIEAEDRAKSMIDKSLDYALRAACVHDRKYCDLRTKNFEKFKASVSGGKRQDLPVLYGVGTAWTSWIQVHSDDWNAIAQLSRVRVIMEKVLALDESYDHGGAHLYMGGLDTILPASMGGKPEQGRIHFERAIELSDGKYLMTKVIYAQQYARLVFDRELHDRLLHDVVQADPRVPGMTLINKIAQARAERLLKESSDYF